MLIVASLLACTGPYGAPYGSTLTVNPEAFTISYGTLFYDDDGFGLVSYAEVAVEGPDSATGDTVPLNNVEVVGESSWPGVYLLPEDAVNTVSSLSETCEANPDAEGCDVFFDDATATYYEVTYEYEYVDELRPNLMYASTNNRGVLPFFLFFDSVPASTADISFDISFSIQVDSFPVEVVVKAVDEEDATTTTTTTTE